MSYAKCAGAEMRTSFKDIIKNLVNLVNHMEKFTQFSILIEKETNYNELNVKVLHSKFCFVRIILSILLCRR